jgi:hypothetical protein
MFTSFKNTIAEKIALYQSNRVIHSFYRNNKIDPSKNIVITGSPRSGTTWLAEIISQSKGAFMLFEPLSLSGVKRLKALGFDWRQHIPIDTEWPEALEYFELLNQGRYLTPWMLSHSDKNELSEAHFFILKFVRANLLLPWYIRNLKPLRPPVFLIRNPIDVISSQLSLNWKNAPAKFNVPQTRFSREFYSPFMNVINEINSTEEFLTARWCIDNAYLIKHPENNLSWITCIYDNLRKHPEDELPELFRRLNLAFDKSLLNNIKQPSKSSYNYEKTTSRPLTQEQTAKCLNIIRLFKLDGFVKENWVQENF